MISVGILHIFKVKEKMFTQVTLCGLCGSLIFLKGSHVSEHCIYRQAEPNLGESSKQVLKSYVRDHYYSSILKISRKQMDLGKKMRILSCVCCTGIVKIGIIAFFSFFFPCVLKSFCIVCPLFAFIDILQGRDLA